jgi:hypothetical protein
MQYFQDATAQKVYAFNPDVVVTNTAGVYFFTTSAGVALTGLPTTLQPCPNNTPPAPPAPTLAQQAGAASAAGLTVTLTGSMTLAATLFPTDSATQAKLGAVVTTINTAGTFPGGATSYPMKDASGAWHTLTIAQYKTLAGAIAAYVAALDLIADGNPLAATALPAASVSLVV